ncbi:MAG: MlaC/ttg2D family ABC transporter substrate-binding protein [Candidatus Binatia bacterium]
MRCGRTSTVLAAAFCTVLLDRPAPSATEAQSPPAAKTGPAGSVEASDPLEFTRDVLGRSNVIVRGPGDRREKLQALSNLLRGFLDTNALGRLAAGKNLENRSAAEVDEFLHLFHEFFVRTYVQRLLLFDAPDFTFGQEAIDGERARVATEVVTPGDRFAVDYQLRRMPEGWRATDIVVEGVSLARNFRSQFDAAVAKDSFEGLLDRLRAKVSAQSTQEGS